VHGDPRTARPDAVAVAKTRNYESDVTKLLRELLEQNPQIAAEQHAGRSRWWDRKLDLDAERRYREATVKQKGYVYF
jgi:hypothetical protein